MSTPTLCKIGQLDALELHTAEGASATISLYGAHLLSWQSADGRERLFLSERAVLDGSTAIRGGVPLIFPQFAARGNGQRHGFARTTLWQVEECGEDQDGAQYAELVLQPEALPPALAAQWPCRLRYRVTLAANSLQLALQVDHLGTQPLQFAAALHTYFRVADLAASSLSGLQGVHYEEAGASGEEAQASLQFAQPIDRMYHHLLRPLHLDGGHGVLALRQSGFSDAVVWNPGQQAAAALSDMQEMEYRDFLCVEAAQLTPVTLEPGQSWTGRHTIELQG